ncbi:cyclic nucleotide-binding domain-containing protein [Vulgatibacter sp.]|uniref:cyclic nucleotide-binding domain-containing protein n=1 Tax=Vulgatibacter sp. TaxID=1971226 RepID=UPI003567057B
MPLWSALATEARADYTAFLLAGLALAIPLIRNLAPPAQRRRVRGMVLLTLAHLALLVAGVLLRGTEPEVHRDLRLASLACAALAAVGILGTLLFSVVLPRLHLALPKILQDVLMAAAGIAALFAVASRVGYDVSGLLTTSAIVTAVIGLALQDTLGNLVAGLAVQSDHSIRIGDWIQVGQLAGRVTEIRWRYTAIETRNWETVFVPNGSLVKNQVTVVGRRDGRPVRWRRWVHFNVDFRTGPGDVIRVVESALRSGPIDHVAADPAPNCILLELGESYARYAVRYWLTDPAQDDAIDSVVRVRVTFALKRAGIPLSMPAHAVFLTEESNERKVEKSEADRERRRDALARVDLFRDLTDDDRRRLAADLSYVPFAAGETITRQGAEAHWLYLLVAGEVSVRIRAESGHESEVSRLAAGSFFGEMSLLTGARRSATVVALDDAECYRLDKAAFEQVVRDRPQLAESLAEHLARRRMEISAIRENLDRTIEPQKLAAAKLDLLERIRDFFGLDDDEDERSRRAG